MFWYRFLEGKLSFFLVVIVLCAPGAAQSRELNVRYTQSTALAQGTVSSGDNLEFVFQRTSGSSFRVQIRDMAGIGMLQNPCSGPTRGVVLGIHKDHLALQVDHDIFGCSRRFFISRDGRSSFSQIKEAGKWKIDTEPASVVIKEKSVMTYFFDEFRKTRANIESESDTLLKSENDGVDVTPRKTHPQDFSKPSSLSAVSPALDTSKEENFCSQIGLIPGTQDFGLCVIKFLDNVPSDFLGSAEVRQALPPRRKPSLPTEKKSNSEPLLSLAIFSSEVDSNGAVTFRVTTNTDTASLLVNGDEIGGRADGQFNFKRFAAVGENTYEVVATDRFGNSQRKTIVVNRVFLQAVSKIRSLNPLSLRAAKARDAVALVIGIERYRSVPSADFANRDASTFVDYARRALGVPPENIRLLTDEKADSTGILLALKNWLPTIVRKDATDVYIFYSGHGLPSEDGKSLFFLPHEANQALLERTAISQNELVAAIQKSSPKSVTMFIDSCYSGQSRTGETLLASARPISIVAKETSSFPPNFTVISASAPDQISSSSPELKHGIFSYYLMRGMEGEADANKDKQITVGEMQTYLSENVTRRAMGMNRTQQPQVVGDTSRVLVGR